MYRVSAFALLALVTTSAARAGDWPQWRGPDRGGHAEFTAPKVWPKELTQKWKVAVGDGVATPALVGDKLFVFTRQGGAEVTRCLDAATGKEVWVDKHDVAFRSGGGDSGYPGPRSSPAVAGGKVVTFGVNGTFSCLDAVTGKKVWRTETGGVPRFHTSSSPLVADGLAIAQVGSERAGGVAAYDLDSGKEKWKWTDDGASYASPVLMTVGEAKMVVAETNASVVGLDLTTGKLLWKTPFPLPGMRNYNSSTPVVQGDTVIFAGSNRGTRAVKIEKKGDAFAVKELWNNKDEAVVHNSPVVAGGFVYGLTARDELFCLSAETGKAAWTAPLGGGGGRGGYGNIVAAGAVLFALPPNAQLTVFEPSGKDFNKVASYKLNASRTYAYPVVAGNRIFVKDADAVTLWTVE